MSCRPQLERIYVADIKDDKLVKSPAWKTKSYEDPDQRAARLEAMARRMK